MPSPIHALLKNRLLEPPRNEVRLLQEARALHPDLEYGDLSTGLLARIARDRGVDLPTCLLYDRIRRSPEHGPFIRELERLEPDPLSLPRLRGRVLIAPAGFYREYPEFGGDGRLVREVAADFGLETRLL